MASVEVLKTEKRGKKKQNHKQMACLTLSAGKGPTLFRDSPCSEFLPYPPQAVSTVPPKTGKEVQKAL